MRPKQVSHKLKFKEYIHSEKIISLHHTAVDGHSVIINDIGTQKSDSSPWHQMMLSSGCRSVGSFPMLNSDKVLGVLNVGISRTNSFNKAEIDLLQELANDLAYALVNLNTQGQQAILKTAAERMQDGLMIADLKGRIIFANSMVAQLTGFSPQSSELEKR